MLKAYVRKRRGKKASYLGVRMTRREHGGVCSQHSLDSPKAETLPEQGEEDLRAAKKGSEKG